MKETLMQYFEWYLPESKSLWKEVSENAEKLSKNGFTMMWLPPAYKGQAGAADVGYGVYDLYDLGEFDAKGSVETKYGSKDEYLQAIKDLQKNDIKALGDIVFNHRMGSDEAEVVEVSPMDQQNRNQQNGDDYEAKVWTKFTFPARNKKYSDYQWDADNFTGTDYNEGGNSEDILKFKGKEWNENVSKENGNFDYVMGVDVDFNDEEVVHELYKWGEWYTKLTGINGFRLDAIKSIDAQFFRDWIEKMHEFGNHPDFAVGEFWSGNNEELLQYLKDSGHCMTLFDVPLHYHFQQASNDPENFDLHTIFDNTITKDEPHFACAFSDNHDTQPGQALESWVQEWFKPHAYAMILLKDSDYPCVFYGDYYGIPHDNIEPMPHLKEMVWIRKNLLEDNIIDFSDENDKQMLAWMAAGEHPVLVILSTGDWKEVEIQDFSLANAVFTDVNAEDHEITMDDKGQGKINCLEKGCSVYILKEDYEKMKKELETI